MQRIEYKGYNITIITSFVEYSKVEFSWKNLLKTNNSKNIYLTPNYFISQFKSRSPNSNPFLIFFSKLNEDVGFILAKNKTRAIPIKFGYLKGKTPQLNILEIEIDGILSNNKIEAESVIVSYIKNLLIEKKFDVLEFQHFSENNFIWDTLKKRGFSKQSVEFIGVEYLAQIRDLETKEKLVYHKSKTLRNFKRSDRILNEQLTNVYLKKYDSLETIDEFIAESEIVSKKSYHSKLGIGIIKTKYWNDLIYSLTKHKYFRGFILYGNSEPIAYNYGVVFENYFFGFNTSFDLSKRKIMPGSFLIRRMIEELLKDKIDYFHFGYGYSEYKKLFSNIKNNESSFLVFSKTPKSIISFWLLSISNYINNKLISTLEKFGVLNKTKMLWRTKISR